MTDEDIQKEVGGLCGPLVLSASELADRLQELPPECGGRGVVAALRTMDPDMRLLVTPDGPVMLDDPSQRAPIKGRLVRDGDSKFFRMEPI